MASIVERNETRGGTVGVDKKNYPLKYTVQLEGVEDEGDLESLVEATAPATYRGQPFQEYRYEHQGCGVFFVEVTYSSKEKKETGEDTISWDLTGGTQTITQSLETISKVGGTAPAWTAPDFGGAIGVNGGKVEGVSIGVRTGKLTVVRRIANEDMTEAYLDLLDDLSQCVNDSEMLFEKEGLTKTYEAGELIFRGSRVQKRKPEDWEVTLEFEISKNRSDFEISQIPVTEKLGWDYLWVLYREEKDTATNVMKKVAEAVYIERVYEFADLTPLFD